MMRPHGFGLAWIDLLFNIVMRFAMLLIMAILLINPKTTQKPMDVDAQSEYLIELSWTDNSTDDVDLWIESPNKQKVGFNHRDAGHMYLDRDDLGNNNAGIPERRELIYIRKTQSGEYTVNVHLYSRRWNQPSVAKVTVYKLKPSRTIVIASEQTLTEPGQEFTMMRFTLNDAGQVIYTNKLQKKMIK